MSRSAAEPLRFSLLSVRALPVRGASGVAVSRAGLLLVEDDLGIYRLVGQTATLWAGPDLHPELGDLEGIAANERGDTVWAVAEDSGVIVELALGARGPTVRRTGRLRRPGARANKGFEGVAFLPARHSSTRRDALVAVHEHKPRRVCLFSLPSLRQTHDLTLPPEAKDALDDLADVAVDPVTGLLVLLSEASRRLAVMRLDRQGLQLVSTFDLPLPGKERPEGLAYLSRGRLAVVTEGPPRLLELRVTRAARAKQHCP